MIRFCRWCNNAPRLGTRPSFKEDATQKKTGVHISHGGCFSQIRLRLRLICEWVFLDQNQFRNAVLRLRISQFGCLQKFFVVDSGIRPEAGMCSSQAGRPGIELENLFPEKR